MVLKYLMKSRVSTQWRNVRWLSLELKYLQHEIDAMENIDSNFVVKSCNLRFRIEANTMKPSEWLDCIGTLKYCIMQKLLQIK